MASGSHFFRFVFPSQVLLLFIFIVRSFEWDISSELLYSWKLERLRGHFLPCIIHCVGKSHNRFKLSTIMERKACIFRRLNVSISSKKSTFQQFYVVLKQSMFHMHIFSWWAFCFAAVHQFVFGHPFLPFFFISFVLFLVLFRNILNNSEPFFSSFFSILLHVILWECKGSI